MIMAAGSKSYSQYSKWIEKRQAYNEMFYMNVRSSRQLEQRSNHLILGLEQVWFRRDHSSGSGSPPIT